MRPDRLYLDDIVEAADAIATFVRGRDSANLADDDLVRSAVLFKLVVIGEAAAKVSAALRASHPEVPWQDVVSFRNFVVHAYFGIDWSIVWETTTVDVPALRVQIAALVPTLDTTT